jgi:hypothetical protein
MEHRGRSAAECDGAITPSPGDHNSDPPEAGAYSTAMVDRAILGAQGGFAAVFRDLLLRRVWLVAAVIQLLDAFTTAAGLHLGLPERNPLTVGVLRAYGSGGLLLQKIVVVGLLLEAMAKLPRRAAVLSVCVVSAVTGAVVCANLVGLVATAR